jgi:hypothetical protein
VTFEVDANGILNVAAEDKGTGKKEKITITAEKGRLSQDEIERMVKEAEEFADQDKAVKAKIDARNQLETFLYNAKSTVEDKAKDKVRARLQGRVCVCVCVYFNCSRSRALTWLSFLWTRAARRIPLIPPVPLPPSLATVKIAAELRPRPPHPPLPAPRSPPTTRRRCLTPSRRPRSGWRRTATRRPTNTRTASRTWRTLCRPSSPRWGACPHFTETRAAQPAILICA